VHLLITELNKVSVNYFLKAKAVSFYFDSNVAEVVKVCDTILFFGLCILNNEDKN